jgi:hypothetical protein
MPTRKYSSRSQQTTLTAGINQSVTSATVVSGSALLGGITISAGEIFTVVIDPDTALEEIVDVTAVSTNTLTIVRAIDGSTAQAHSAGAVIRHMAIGRDYREANSHIENSTTAHGLTIANVLETTDTNMITTAMLQSNAVTTVKITDLNVTTGKIADSAITSAKILDGAIVNADINTSAAIDKTKIAGTAVTVADTGTVTSTMIENGTITNTDINASAGIAYSKLNLTGSITSSDITDATIVNADISGTAAIALSKLATDPLARANHTGTQTASTISDFDTQVRTNRLDQMAAPTSAVSANSQKVTNLATPTSSTDASTKGYVDTQITNLIGTAPSTLDTLQEIATAINNDAGLYTTLNNGKLNRDGTQAMTGALPMGTFKVTGVGDPTNAQDAATKNYVDTGVNSGVVAAAASATAAAASATSASGSATSATNSATSATSSASSATSSASSATASASAAATSATNAANSATSASNSATTASTQATNAANSASSAGTSATNAGTSATNASASASSASTSQTSATASATSATASATAAATSETNAAASASAASTSQTAAAASASAASTSQTAAANSATAADNSAGAASGYATAASTSATNAATSASSAATTYDNFDDRYLGSKASAPTVDNDGNTLLVGAIYWNSTLNNMYVWSGSTWVQIATTTVYTAPTIGSTTIDSGTTYGTITGLTLSGGLASADPTTSLGLATKQYVDAVVTQINYHAAVVAATTANLTATYNNGTSGVGATLTNSGTQAAFSIDGVSPAVNARILVKDQTTQTQNGIYTLTTIGSGSTNWVLTRATDADNNPSGEMRNGDELFCSGGTLNANKSFINSTTVDPIVIGTTSITFSEYYAALPSQGGNSGKYLTTDGTTPSWGTVAALSSTTPSALGTAAVGTGTTSARADHVHPTTGLGLTASGLNQFAATTSAQLAGVISDETGTGALVFANTPTLVTPSLGVATATSINGTAIPSSKTLVATDTTDFVSTAGGSTITVSSGTTVPLTIQNNGTGNSLVVNDVASDTTPFVVNASGNVGISTSTPATQLSLGGYGALSAVTGNGTSYLTHQYHDVTGADSWSLANNYLRTNSSVGTVTGPTVGTAEIQLLTSGAGSYVGAITFGTSPTINTAPTQRMIIDKSGNVGIGDNASYPLHVTNATAQIGLTSSTGTNLARVLMQNGSGSFQLGIDSSTGSTYGLGGYSRVIWNDGAYPLVFTTNSAERMRIDGSGNTTINSIADGTTTTAARGAGYMGLPQNSTTTGAYSVVAADAGKHIYSTATRTVTLPANGSIALPIGTAITFISGAGATTTIAITTDTMILVGPGTTGSRTLAAHGMATAIKVAATTWYISGNGLT